MDRPRSDIISFIGKQLKYETLPPDVLADVCLVAYSVSDIVNTINIVRDAFEENIDYTLPRSTTSTNIREDLFQIFEYLRRFPCSVGQERRYTDHIEKRAFVARLVGMNQVVTALCKKMKKPDESVSSGSLQQAQSSNAADTGAREIECQDNSLAQPEQMPINENQTVQEPGAPIFPAYAENREEIEPDHMGEEMRALSVNPPAVMLNVQEELKVLDQNQGAQISGGQGEVRGNPIQLMVSARNEDDRVSAVRVELVDPRNLIAITPATVQQTIEQAPATPEPKVDAPAVPVSNLQEDNSEDSTELDVSNLSTGTCASPVSHNTSEEDLFPLTTMEPVTDTSMEKADGQERLPRPIAPPAQRLESESLQGPPRIILVPKPVRAVRNWRSSEESRSSDLEPPCSKRSRRIQEQN